MEKVWDELKRIEAQAEQIRSEAQDKAKKIVVVAKQDAEKLVVNSKVYAEAESQKRYTKAVEDANLERNTHLQATEHDVAELKTKAEKNMGKAVDAVLNAVLED
jgi:F0F1-type ATP synthase membrane subunit b/b'